MPLVSRVEELLATGVQRKVFRCDADPHQVLMTIMSLGFFVCVRPSHLDAGGWGSQVTGDQR